MNLVPEKRVDRNGVMVTRHVRATIPKSTQLLPAPTAEATTAGHVLTAAQTREWELDLRRSSFHIRRELYEILRPERGNIAILSNDANTYAMLSMLSPDDALTLMDSGIDTAEKARTFMKEHLLQDIEIDRQEFASEALKRGIPARDYLKMCDRVVTRNSSPANVLDAAEVFGMEPLAEHPDFYLDVMIGAINVADIKEIGPELIGEYPHHDDIKELLRSMKAGEIKLDSRQVKLLMEWSVNEDMPISKYVDVIKVCGFEKLFAITNIEAASSMAYHVSDKFGDDPEEKFARIVQYEQMAILFDAMPPEIRKRLSWRSMPFTFANEMYDAGIEPKIAVECYRDGISATQYLAIKEHGIAPSVSGGWL